MKGREILFDMDGTIADTYGVKDWLPKLRAENPEPYRVAKPLYDMDTLNCIVSMLKDSGYRIKVVSWGSLDSTPEYLEATRAAKEAWLKQYGFPADEVYVIPYGEPKSNYAGIDSILVDDNKSVCETFLASARGILKRRVIDATQNICEKLVDLLIADVA